MSAELVSVERVVKAPPDTIFDILADPARHPEIDGSGMVKAARADEPQRLTLGATFGMDMKMGAAPYKITNTVVEFEENRRIAWRHFGGHRWRYILEPLPDGTTKVTEQFDWSTAKSPLLLKLAGYPKKNRKAIEQTLERLAARFA